MARLSNTILLIGLLSWTVIVHGAGPAQEVQIHNGMGMGQDYLRMPEPERPAYVMGLVNGLFLSPLFGASRRQLAWLETCLEEKSGKQIAELLSQYLELHPTEQHEQLHAASYRALLQACPSSPTNRPLRKQSVGVRKNAAKRSTGARGSSSGRTHRQQQR